MLYVCVKYTIRLATITSYLNYAEHEKKNLCLKANMSRNSRNHILNKWNETKLSPIYFVLVLCECWTHHPTELRSYRYTETIAAWTQPIVYTYIKNETEAQRLDCFTMAICRLICNAVVCVCTLYWLHDVFFHCCSFHDLVILDCLTIINVKLFVTIAQIFGLWAFRYMQFLIEQNSKMHFYKLQAYTFASSFSSKIAIAIFIWRWAHIDIW